MTDEPAVYDHYRETESDGDDNGDSGDSNGNRELFRVVGVNDERVTLLRLTENGNRTATGDLQYVTREHLEEAFTPDSNPDPRYGLLTYLAGLFVVGGIGLAASSPDDRFAGAFLAASGLYLLWRRHG